jgi:sialic acid synthase SpsE
MFPEAVDWLEEVGVKRYKIRYADRDNHRLVGRVLLTGKITHTSGKDVYCVPKYPPSLAEIHVPDPCHGYSNHYPGMAPALLAVARGAEYVEIHVKDNDTAIDAPVSWTFDELRRFAAIAREVEQLR